MPRLLLALIILSAPLYASRRSDTKFGTLHLSNFEFSGLYVRQTEDAYFFSPQAALALFLWLNNHWSMKLKGAVSPFKALDGKLFVASSLASFIGFFPVNTIGMDLGGGVEYWLNGTGVVPVVGADICINLAYTGVLQKIFIGAHLSHFFEVPTEKFEIGFSFDLNPGTYLRNFY